MVIAVETFMFWVQLGDASSSLDDIFRSSLMDVSDGVVNSDPTKALSLKSTGAFKPIMAPDAHRDEIEPPSPSRPLGFAM
jgi:hypothetical protein